MAIGEQISKATDQLQSDVGRPISEQLETIRGQLKCEIPALSTSDLFEAQRISEQRQNAAAEVTLD